jgi:hypothetical protein
MRVCGIDPGLSSGGMVLLNDDKVLAAASLVEKRGAVSASKKEAESLTKDLSGWGDKQFIAASIRTKDWLIRAEKILLAWKEEYREIDFYAVESFVDQPSRAKQEKAGLLRNRWQTPFVMGGLAHILFEQGVSVDNGKLVYQNAGVVIRQWHKEIAALENGGSIYPGDHIITNDHLRKALVHALALQIRVNRSVAEKKKDLN